MLLENDNQVKNESGHHKGYAFPKKQSNLLSKLSILVSISAIGFSGYVFLNFQSVSYQSHQNQVFYQQLQSQLVSLKTYQETTEHFLSEVNSQAISQASSVKAVQSQINSLTAQVDVPTKDLYKQISIASIQSAISYLVLAKDVAMFSGDVSKAQSLVDTAFDKIEASRVASISAKDRLRVTESIKKYASKKSIVSQFMAIQSELSGLHYLTPESLPKKAVSDNKYFNMLSAMVEVQSIPENQTLVSTTQSKLYVADELYNSLISFQRAMYTNDAATIQSTKLNLLRIVQKYFVQDANSKRLEQSIGNVQQKSTDTVESSLDNIITSLATQQNTLLARTNTISQSLSAKRGAK